MAMRGRSVICGLSTATVLTVIVILFYYTSPHRSLPPSPKKVSEDEVTITKTKKFKDDSPMQSFSMTVPHSLPLKDIMKSQQALCNDTLPALTYLWKGTHVRINESAAKHYSNPHIVDECRLGFFNKYWDYDDKWSEFYILKPGKGYELPKLEQYILVVCGQVSYTSSLGVYSRLHLRLAETPEVKYKLNIQKQKNKRRLSVLVFLIDGMSSMMAHQTLNSTYHYLLKDQQAVALNGYHTVGLKTGTNLLSYLTGQRTRELSENYDGPFNWPFIWKDFSQDGYVTAYTEDSTNSLLDREQNIFREQHIDYYLKGFLNAIKSMGSCRSTGEYLHKNMLNTLDSFLTQQRSNSFFAWWFTNKKEMEQLSTSDVDYFRFFKQQFEKRRFNNTLVIFGSARSGKSSSAKHAAEKHPLHLLLFPDWFKVKYRRLYRTLQVNAESSLTTPFDMYKTLLDVLRLDERTAHGMKAKPKNKGIGLSLFEEISPSRTCQKAGVSAKLCV